VIARADGFVPGAAGVPLYWRAWLPQAAPRHALLFIHGLAEHSGRYENPAAYFAPRGYACYAVDYRGHGRSPGRRGHVGSFDDYLGDVSDGLDLVRTRHPEIVAIPVGHSQGGLIALLLALREPARVPRLVLSSPFLGVLPEHRPAPPLRIAARALSRVWPAASFPSPVDARFLSSDPAVGAAYTADPLVSHTISAGWFASLQRAQDEVRQAAARLAVPTLLLVAGRDRIVDGSATLEWARRAASGHLTLEHWPELWHELFNEPAREAVFQRMEAWLEAPPA
jgi:alpha-beta hydrolase superfamily lysophospholipase